MSVRRDASSGLVAQSAYAFAFSGERSGDPTSNRLAFSRFDKIPALVLRAGDPSDCRLRTRRHRDKKLGIPTRSSKDTQLLARIVRRDRDAFTDIEVLASGIEDAFTELLKIAQERGDS